MTSSLAAEMGSTIRPTPRMAHPVSAQGAWIHLQIGACRSSHHINAAVPMP